MALCRAATLEVGCRESLPSMGAAAAGCGRQPKTTNATSAGPYALPTTDSAPRDVRLGASRSIIKIAMSPPSSASIASTLAGWHWRRQCSSPAEHWQRQPDANTVLPDPGVPVTRILLVIRLGQAVPSSQFLRADKFGFTGPLTREGTGVFFLRSPRIAPPRVAMF